MQDVGRAKAGWFVIIQGWADVLNINVIVQIRSKSIK